MPFHRFFLMLGKQIFNSLHKEYIEKQQLSTGIT